MYIHIGGEKVIKKKDIIGVFDLDTTSVSAATKEYFKKAQREKKILSVSDELPKTYIIAGGRGREKMYISPISTQTLIRRSEKRI